MAASWRAPAAQLAEQHHEQRGGVGGAVVGAAAAEREGRRPGRTGPRAGSCPAPPRTPGRPRCPDGRPGSAASRARGWRPTGSSIHDVSSESRPNRAMNQGAPAATTGRPGMLGVEDAQRAEVLDAAAQHRRKVRLRRSAPAGRRAATRAAAGGDGVLDRLAARVVQLQRDHRRRQATASMLTVHSPRAGTVARHDRVPLAASGLAVTLDEQRAVTLVPPGSGRSASRPRRPRWRTAPAGSVCP